MGGRGGRERGAEEEERVMGSRALSAVDSALGIRFPSLFRYNALLFFSSRLLPQLSARLLRESRSGMLANRHRSDRDRDRGTERRGEDRQKRQTHTQRSGTDRRETKEKKTMKRSRLSWKGSEERVVWYQ
jgi:hypothetical protein